MKRRTVIAHRNSPHTMMRSILYGWCLAISQAVWGGPWGLWVFLWSLFVLFVGLNILLLKHEDEVNITEFLKRENGD